MVSLGAKELSLLLHSTRHDAAQHNASAVSYCELDSSPGFSVWAWVMITRAQTGKPVDEADTRLCDITLCSFTNHNYILRFVDSVTTNST